MTPDAVTISPADTFRSVQRLLKDGHFSGVPVVDNGKLVGLVSIDDLISALDAGAGDEAVEKRMTRTVLTIPQNYSLIAATNLFNKHGFGRLPVVDKAESDHLVGIITNNDILRKLLLMINCIAEGVEEREAAAADTVDTSKGSIRFEVAPDDFIRAGIAATSIKAFLKKHGLLPALLRRIAVICYEAEMNMVIHSLGGVIEAQMGKGEVAIIARDRGPGIPDLEKAMRQGFTTANEKIRALGFGAGMGLNNIQTCSDKFEIDSDMLTGTNMKSIVFTDSEGAGK